jgi:hypothetical protein
MCDGPDGRQVSGRRQRRNPFGMSLVAIGKHDE